jgi:hypothetical protein
MLGLKVKRNVPNKFAAPASFVSVAMTAYIWVVVSAANVSERKNSIAQLLPV